MRKVKGFTKALSLLLTVIMISTLLPVVASAAPTGFKDGDLLLQMSAMDENCVEYAYDGVEVSPLVAFFNMKKDANDPTKVVSTKKDTNAKAGGIGIKTNLPLSKETSYTIAYRAKVNAEVAMYFGLCQNESYPYYGADLLFGTKATANGNPINTHNKWWANVYKNDNGGDGGWEVKNVWTSVLDSEGFAHFVITIEDGWMSVAIGGVEVSRKWNLNAPKNTNDATALDDFAIKELWLETGFATSFANVADDPYVVPEAGTCVFEIKDISIYAGRVYVSPYNTGDLILQMGSLSKSSVTYNPYNITLGASTPVAAKLDENDTTRILCNQGGTDNKYGGVGFTTGLPLTQNTAYEIEYYAKVSDLSKGLGAYLGICQNTGWAHYGVDMFVPASGTTVTTHTKWWSDGYYKEGSDTDFGGTSLGSNVWETKADSDGFVKFRVIFDGRFMTFEVADTPIGVAYDLLRPRHTNFPAVDDWTLKTLAISGGYTNIGASSATSPSVGDCILEIKNISVYAGQVTNNKPNFVKFKDESGKLLDSYIIEGGSVTVNEFPNIGGEFNDPVIWIDEATGEEITAPVTFTEATTVIGKVIRQVVTINGTDGKPIEERRITDGSLTIDALPDVKYSNQLVWIWEETGAVVTLPMTFNAPATLKAYDMGPNENKTLAIQCTEASGGKQSVRFIGGVYNTEGSGVGFDVTVKYKDASGQLVEDTYRIAGNMIYDRINATESGDAKNATAYELGGIYVFGAELTGVPTDIGQIDITVKSFKQVGARKIRIYGNELKLSIVNGVADSSAVPLS